MNLNTVFLSTDAPNDEVNHLKSFLPPRIEVKQFVNNDSLSDGEVAIIDQVVPRFIFIQSVPPLFQVHESSCYSF